MKRIPVKSSRVRATGYDMDSKTLEVEFPNGRVYRYKDVTPEEYEHFHRSDSMGAHLNTLAQKHEYTQVENPD